MSDELTNDDVFSCEGTGGMTQCISGFGRNAIDQTLGDVEDHQRGDATYAELQARLKYNIGELVRWCRGLNRKAQEATREVEQLRAELATTREQLRLANADAEAMRAALDNLLRASNEGDCSAIRKASREAEAMLSHPNPGQSLADRLAAAEAEGWGAFLSDLAAWQDKQFGTGQGPIGALNHLIEEANEAKAEPGNVTEYADCLMLIVCAARRAGFDATALLNAAIAKLAVCKTRKWEKVLAGKPCKHIEAAAIAAKGGQQA